MDGGRSAKKAHRLLANVAHAEDHGRNGGKEIAGAWHHAPGTAGADGQLRSVRAHRQSAHDVSGQICLDGDGKLVAKGQLGGGVSIEDGQKAARACAINLLAQVKAALGDLDKVARVVRLGGFINSAPGFTEGPKVMNGASDLMVAVFGDKGKHARSTVGVAALPADAAVEVEGLFEVS